MDDKSSVIEMDGIAITLTTLGLVFAGVVKGVTGVGYITCAIPFLVGAVGLEAAMTLVIAPALAANFGAFASMREFRSICSSHWPMYLAMLPGVGVGLLLLIRLDPKYATAALGMSLILYSVYSLIGKQGALGLKWARFLQVPVGASTGIVAGFTGSQVMPLVPYILAQGFEARQAIQAINIGVILLTSVLGLGLYLSGLMNVSLFTISVFAAVPALLGAQLGERLRRSISTRHARGLLMIVLAVIGAKMLLS